MHSVLPALAELHKVHFAGFYNFRFVADTLRVFFTVRGYVRVRIPGSRCGLFASKLSLDDVGMV